MTNPTHQAAGTPPIGQTPRHTARAILVDGTCLVVIRRFQPLRDPEPYWVTVGGGIDPDDLDAEAAMRREVLEEIGGTVGPAELVLVLQEDKARGVRSAHFFLTALESMDLAKRTGEEFADPQRGTYDVERIPFTAEGISSIRLLPDELARWLGDNADALLLRVPSLQRGNT